MRLQRTLTGVAACEGIGLHSGEPVQVVIHPAPIGTGIRFIRTDLDDALAIQAHARHVSDTYYATTLSAEGVSIGTVEHLMAALFGLGIVNAEIHVKGTELPILDGSAREWVSLIRQVGTVDQGGAVPEIVIRKPIGVKSHNQWATLHPFSGFAVECTIDFPHPLIGKQRWEGVVSEDVFTKELADARTFGLVADVPELQRRGRVKGASRDNVIALDESSVVSPGGLRYPDEFVRHKVLDAVGDLSLLGVPIRGLLVSNRSGHRIHQQLLRVLLESRDCWELSAPESMREKALERQVKRVLRIIS